MDRDEASQRIFREVFNNKQDVTDRFFETFGWTDADRAKRMSSDSNLRRRMRRDIMSQKNGGIFDLSVKAAPYLDQAKQLLLEGQVGAVDGTNALATTDLMTCSMYACAVGWITSRERGNPNITVSTTSVKYIDETTPNEELNELDISAEEDNRDRSWPTTFREYEERYVALYKCPAPFVFIDGPVITQNLVTQTVGRQLYEEMFQSKKTFIGIIKDISRSTRSALKWGGHSLQSGEGWDAGSALEALKRYGLSWTQGARPDDYVRIAIRPNQKAFAIECRRKDVGLACALLQADASVTVNHELPVLLETVDAQLRAGFNGSMTRNIVLNRMMRQSDNLTHDDYQSAIDAINEREFR